MTYVLVCPSTGSIDYFQTVPHWCAGAVTEHASGRGRARNIGAERAILDYKLTDEDWLIFVDDDADLSDCPPPPDKCGLAVPIYVPAWEDASKDYSSTTPISLVNVANVLGLGPVTVGTCIAVKVGVWNYLGRFQEHDDVLEDNMFGVTAKARGVIWSLWRAKVKVTRRYSNDWMTLP